MKILTAILFLFLLSYVFAFSSFAQSAINTPGVPLATSDAKFINVSYDLPYPGILPDNPLYFLKALRDNLINVFISDTIKKANYDLLMADKRLTSADALIGKKSYQLGITTLSKSGNYFDQAIQLTQQEKAQGADVKELLNKLYVASQKHQQVIYLMAQKTKDRKTKFDLELLQVRAKNFQDTVDVIRSQ